MLSAYGGGDEPVCMGALPLHFILSRMGQGRLHLVICELIYSVKLSFFALVVRRQERRCIVMEPSVTV
jgi:hypothetical protein